MKGTKIKKVYGERSLIVTDMNINLLEAYRLATKERLSFYVQSGDSLCAWGLFSVADYMGIKDVSIALNRINA